VLAARESPLSTVHLRNLLELSRMGGMIVPPMLSYYRHPKTIGDCTVMLARRILRQFLPDNEFPEWEGMQ